MLMSSRYKGKLARQPLQRSYELTPDLLGRGGYGEVWRGMHRDGGDVAVKVVPLSGTKSGQPPRDSTGTELRASLSELEVMARVGSHDSLVTLRKAFMENGSLYLVTDLLEDDLCNVLMKRQRAGLPAYDEATACRFFYRLLRGLNHLHSHGVVHRDVKLDNIMLRRSDDLCSAQLGDFGLATIVRFGDPRPSGAVGSLQYIAPEVLLSADNETSYDFGADLWSAGVVLYAVLGGKFPFGAGRKGSSEQKILEGTVNFDGASWSNVGDGAKSLIRKLLVVDPRRRLTARQALRHPWFADLKAEEAEARERAKSADSSSWRTGVRDLVQQLTGLAAGPEGNARACGERQLPQLPVRKASERSATFAAGMESLASMAPSAKLPPLPALGANCSRRRASAV